MPRPTPPGDRRYICLQIFVNDPEWEQLEEAAAEHDLHYAEFARRKMFNRPLPKKGK